jgi:hypothetical protein
MRHFSPSDLIVLNLSFNLISLAFSLPALADDSPIKAPSKKMFFSGDCVLDMDPDSPEFSANLKACVNASVGILARTDSDYRQNSWDYFGSVYSGIHWSDLISAHFRGDSYASKSTTEGTKSKRPISTMDELSLRIGNRALDQTTGTVGFQDLPFGLNLNPAGRFRSPDPHRSFWETEKMGLYGSWQDDFDLRLDFGLSTNVDNPGSQESRGRDGVALRITKAISALDGTQFLASMYGKEAGLRRLGLAMLNSSRRGEQTGIEWIRESIRKSDQPFRQIIRIAYTGARVRKNQWTVVYSNIIRDERTGEVGNNMALNSAVNILLAVKYTASDISEIRSHWTLTTGVAASL